MTFDHFVTWQCPTCKTAGETLVEPEADTIAHIVIKVHKDHVRLAPVPCGVNPGHIRCTGMRMQPKPEAVPS